jgi:hypothetical protein
VLAATATDPELQDTLASMAQKWIRLARRAEAAEALVDNPQKPSSKKTG